MASVTARSFDNPDETRKPDKTQVEVVDLGDVKAARMRLSPGWRWSECIKPVVGTDSCQAEHLGYAVSGRMHVEHEDGTAAEIGPGDAYHIAPRHDAWVLGDEAFVGMEFKSAGDFAER
jgi:hypothetical protein